MERLIELFRFLLGLFGRKVASQPPSNAPQGTGKAQQPPPSEFTGPKLDPGEYKRRLQEEALKSGKFNWKFSSWEDFIGEYGYTSVKDDPNTPQIETQTYCNFFTRKVCTWFGWRGFNMPDRDQAGEITRYMRSHPQIWQKLEKDGSPDYEAAARAASQGHLIVAGQENPLVGQPGQSTGHVCVIAPEPVETMQFSSKWQRKVPLAANVGGGNWYGKGLSWAFNKQPELFLYRGNQA